MPLVLDKAGNADDRRLLEMIFSRNTLAYPIAAPPGVPPERARQLREALAAMAVDPAFLADARKENLPVEFSTGETVARVVADIYSTPPELVERVRRAVREGRR